MYQHNLLWMRWILTVLKIDNRPNTKITQEMYEVLERNYGEE